jgi:hypothetical protein
MKITLENIIKRVENLSEMTLKMEKFSLSIFVVQAL